MHILSEFFVFFLLSFAALSLGTAEINAHLGIQTVSGICFSNNLFFKLGIPISLSIALMSFVGTEMGRGCVKTAKDYVKMGVFVFICACLICSAIMWFF